ncbi:hypothetical protein GCM10011316_36180 [Roseibium aquae]|uniref:Beta-lactamase hydrolase-like protein phosphatase-like domain-containing protein n=1 Tax=Roseibium aquae TaxID=1323746 RepID=A0A916TN64_9HYPH|nr:TIGR01244 family sulfur transferase [Roseibium aquae]GGB60941.1 hypothetical protein GCM10011316_36180 [Roseibium aquae]
MTPKQITDEISVSPQIDPEDLADIKALGFKSVICNRPDGESPDQPSYEEIAAAAAAAGLEIRNLPIVSGGMTQHDVDAFAAAMEDLPKPVFAYCRSGTRCATAWAFSQAKTRPANEILEQTAAAGYDLRSLFGQ